MVILFNGKIYIEVIVVAVLFIIFILGILWRRFSTKKLMKNYNPEDDKARKGEPISIVSRGTAETEPNVADASRQGEFERRELLQAAVPDDAGKTVPSTGENNKPVRRVFRFGRRRRTK